MAEENKGPKQEENKDKNFRYIVRVANADLDGNKPVGIGLKKIKGVGYNLANSACLLAGIDPVKKSGNLSDSEIAKINDVISNPSKFKVPSWMLNRRKDPETGDDLHVLGGDLQFAKENDIKFLKKIKCYRGTRHMHGLPSRGQRTKSNFRKSKSRGKGSLGVTKKKGK